MSVAVPPNTPPGIRRLFAYVSVDADGNEGICASTIGRSGMFVTLVTGDPGLLPILEPAAKHIAEITGLKVVLVEFSQRTELRDVRETRQ
jgi:hypothetical protein